MGRGVLLECFFDCSSPWTYMGFENIQGVAERQGVEVAWTPILVGGVFNAVNPGVYAEREAPSSPAKAAYLLKDMQDWARRAGLVVRYPPACGHPVNAVKCMRGCLVAQARGRLVPFARAAFEALWIDGQDLARDELLAAVSARAGLDPAELLAEIATPPIKARLRENTEALVARGGFGSPTFFVDGADMYFGNDRVDLVEAAVAARLAGD